MRTACPQPVLCRRENHDPAYAQHKRQRANHLRHISTGDLSHGRETTTDLLVAPAITAIQPIAGYQIPTIHCCLLMPCQYRQDCSADERGPCEAASIGSESV